MATHNRTSDDQGNDMLAFKILKKSRDGSGPRLGRLTLSGKPSMETPHYIGITSRGFIPHISQDMMRKHTSSQGVYIALEDFIEKAPRTKPPILSQPELERSSSPLEKFIALPEGRLTILGARRTPPVACPLQNSQTSVAILTSVGFGQLESEDFTEAIKILKPDIVVGLGDMPLGDKPPGAKRREKMSNRTSKWMREIFSVKNEAGKAGESLVASVFAPVLPLSRGLQGDYLDSLGGELKAGVSGLAFYDADTITYITKPLSSLPRLSLTDPKSPHEVLREVALGIDISTIPFIGAATDAGIALDFNFPVPSPIDVTGERRPLGLDMWQSVHATDLAPLAQGCDCYACSKHHRAYIQHLFSAKEMLAWVLLQVHNLRTLDHFFAGIRKSVDRGTIDEDVEAFARMYEPNMPEKTGQGPRIRGYQRKSEGPGEPKQNPVAYRILDDGKVVKAEAPRPEPEADAEELEDRGFEETTSSL